MKTFYNYIIGVGEIMRYLNKHEMEIIKIKEERSKKKNGKQYHANYIEYRKLFPRSTLCILSKVLNPSLEEMAFGITMQSKHDTDIESIGHIQSFIRALNSM